MNKVNKQDNKIKFELTNKRKRETYLEFWKIEK
jgi:hypothetical protein